MERGRACSSGHGSPLAARLARDELMASFQSPAFLKGAEPECLHSWSSLGPWPQAVSAELLTEAQTRIL